MTRVTDENAGTITIGEKTVRRLGFGAMRITGRGIWGPPEDHLETLLRTVGVDRFVFGTGQPLRLPENSVAKLDLLALSPEHRSAIEAENAMTLSRSSIKSKTSRVKA